MGVLATIINLCVAMTAFGARGAYGHDTSVFDVLNYGAKGDGQFDDSNAFLKTWDAACKRKEAGQTPTIVVPAGKSFLVHPLHFQGPCKSAAINFQVLGIITAPTKIEKWQNCESGSWIYFSEITNLTVAGTGSGVINGRGRIWWDRHKSHLLPHDDGRKLCQSPPKGMTFFKMENLEVSGLTYLNSPKAHIRLQKCISAKLTALQIYAPRHSPNTDGIVIGGSSHIKIHHSTIGTGDDCISIKGGSSFINITGIQCGPGHGISVGSLGYKGTYETVEEVNVRDCVFNSTQNGVRIKTWEGGYGYVRGIHFQNITNFNAHNPIIINQGYCDHQRRICETTSSGVEISDVTYQDVKGTSGSQPSIMLRCIEGTGCTNIVMKDINLDASKPRRRNYAYCQNVVNGIFSSVHPPVFCPPSS